MTFLDYPVCRCGHQAVDHYEGTSTCLVGLCRCEQPEAPRPDYGRIAAAGVTIPPTAEEHAWNVAEIKHLRGVVNALVKAGQALREQIVFMQDAAPAFFHLPVDLLDAWDAAEAVAHLDHEEAADG